MYGSQPTNTVYNVQQILVIAFEFTDAAYGFTINFLCGPQGQKGRQLYSPHVPPKHNKTVLI